MSPRVKPPFRADHVGSLIRPDALIRAREAAEKNEIAAEELARIQHEAIRAIVRLQEDIGFKLATDGEYNRIFWQRDFLVKFENVQQVAAKLTVRFHSAAGSRDHSPPTLEVSGKLNRPRAIFVDDFRFLASVAHGTPKVTIPSPTTMHFRGGRDAIDRHAYPDIDEFYADLARVYREEIADLAAAGCRYLQIDEVNFAYLCDPALRAQVRNIGEEPQTLPKTYARLINQAIAGRPADMVVCLHLCRGNFAGAWVPRAATIRSPKFSSTTSPSMAISSNTIRRAPAALRRCDFCRRARSPCSASSPRRARSLKPRTNSSAGSTKRAVTPRSNSLRFRRNAASPAASAAMR